MNFQFIQYYPCSGYYKTILLANVFKQAENICLGFIPRSIISSIGFCPVSSASVTTSSYAGTQMGYAYNPFYDSRTGRHVLI
jgi:hypothetical protein